MFFSKMHDTLGSPLNRVRGVGGVGVGGIGQILAWVA